MHFSCLRFFSIAVASVLLAEGSFGKLAISSVIESTGRVLLNCSAQDDRAALIWNDDLQRNSSDEIPELSTKSTVHDPNCAIVASSGCIVVWEISNETDSDESSTWKLVSSLSYPMGPVFDSRWEGFQQYSFPSEYGVHHKHGEFLEFSRAIVFSIRGKGTASFKLCEHYNATQNPCIPVTIPNDSFPLSEICVGQVQWIEVNNEYTCTGKIIPLKNGESPINESEWHTFTLHSSSGNPSASRYLFMKSLSPGKIRYHDYHYFLTEKENSKLSTSEFNHTENIFCIELLVSLCSTCELNVQLVDSSNVTQIIGTITGYQSADSNLPIWKFDKLNVTLEGLENRFRLEILSVMKQYSTDARWAVDSFRKCQPEGTLRSVSFRVESAHSNITCQKLSYTGSSVVKYDSTVTNFTSTGNNSLANNSDSSGNSHSDGNNEDGNSDEDSNSSENGNSDENSDSGEYDNSDEHSNSGENGNSDEHSNSGENGNSDEHSNSGENGNSDEHSNSGENGNSDEHSNSGENGNSDEHSNSGGNGNSAKDSNPGDKVNPAANNHSSDGQYGPLDIGLIFLAVISTLATFALLLLIFQRECTSSPESLHRENSSSRRRTISNFVRWTANKIFQDQPLLMPTMNNAESLESVSTAEAESGLYSHSVMIKDFEDYVKKSIPTGLLRSQFRMLPRGLHKPCKYGFLPENFPKNRYHNIIPYDHSRVKLQKVEGDPHSDYINANYVHGFQKQKSYIAAQGPKPNTTVDFWRMIWQSNSLVICMLANVVEGPKGREMLRCTQYWPDLKDSVTHGAIVVVNEDTREFCDFTLRTFRVTCGQETRMIEHLHYTSWPDHGVPLHPNSLINYLKQMHTLPAGSGPIIVHCSAGIGRTGTIILCDVCFRRASAEGTVDVLAEFEKLRNSRTNMVDNELQYMFAHVVLVEWLVSLPTHLPCNDTLPQMIEELKKSIPDHIERLQKTAWQEEVLHALVSLGLSPPQPLMVDYPARRSTAVIVDGVRAKKQYFLSRLPSQSILSEFWEFVEKQEIELVIILQRLDPEDPTYCSIIPGAELSDTSSLVNVELKEGSDSDQFPTILTGKSEITFGARQVAVLTCLEWGPGKNGQPPPPKELVKFWLESEKIRREKGPTLVLCHDGIEGCGLFSALSFLLERMAVEKVCDIMFAVRTIRRSRKEFVRSLEQFEYLYDAAAAYVESVENHANGF